MQEKYDGRFHGFSHYFVYSWNSFLSCPACIIAFCICFPIRLYWLIFIEFFPSKFQMLRSSFNNLQPRLSLLDSTLLYSQHLVLFEQLLRAIMYWLYNVSVYVVKLWWSTYRKDDLGDFDMVFTWTSPLLRSCTCRKWTNWKNIFVPFSFHESNCFIVFFFSFTMRVRWIDIWAICINVSEICPTTYEFSSRLHLDMLLLVLTESETERMIWK